MKLPCMCFSISAANSEKERAILNAMRHIEDYSCVTFREKQRGDPKHVLIYADSSRCT